MIVLPGAPLVRSGPYRWFAHPNYVAVIVEGAALPLTGSAWITACAFTVANAALLTVRIRCEIRGACRRGAAWSCQPVPRHDRRACRRRRPGWPCRGDLLHAGGPVGQVAEPRAAPVDKACGEGVMPAAVRRLAALGVTPDGHPLRGIRYLDAAHQADAPFRHGDGLGVRRTVLHAALAAGPPRSASRSFRPG